MTRGLAGDSRAGGLPARPLAGRGPVDPPAATPPEVPELGLAAALRRVRDELASIRFPLALPDAEQAAETTRTLTAQLDDYLLPRLARLDAPLLVVVGGSTGVGKSTLVNSMVRAPVTQSGVLRPTTRAPVVVCAPADARWFLGPLEPRSPAQETGSAAHGGSAAHSGEESDPVLLPGLPRTTGLNTSPGMLRVITATGLPRGLALLDAPDLDSVDGGNRELAAQVLGAADFWLFVTTASRYADAVPWEALRTARDRGTRLALVLNRVPAGAEQDIGSHLREMLDAEGLPAVELFVLAEVALDGQGLIPEDRVIPLHDWLLRLAEDPATRVRVVGDTLSGALAALRWGAEGLAEAIDRQHLAGNALRAAVDSEYSAALSTVDTSLARGDLLRGEILVRWREFVTSGELRAAIAAQAGRGRRMGVAFGRKPPPGGKLQGALAGGLVTLIAEAVTGAADRTWSLWTAQPAGEALLAGVERPGRRTERARALVRDWREYLVELAGGDSSRHIPYPVHVTGLLIMLGVLGGEHPAEVADPAAARVLGQLSLRTLVVRARDDLLRRVRDLLDKDATGFTQWLADVDATAGSADRLRAALSTGAPARRTGGAQS